MKLEVEDSKDKLPIDDPSRCFNLIDYGLPGSFFSNRDLEFQSPFDFVSDNIIEFWIKQSISSSPCSEKFFYIYANLLTIYDNNGIDIVKEFCASMKNENIRFFPVNTAGLYWQLIVIVNALDNEKSIVIIYFRLISKKI